MPFKRAPRRRRRANRQLATEVKLATYKHTSIKYPSNNVGPYSAAGSATGGLDGGTASPSEQFSHFIVPGQNSEPNPQPASVQFGSRSRVVYEGVPSTGNWLATLDDHPVDGSFPICLVPASYDGANNVSYEQYTGRKFATTGVSAKISFFATGLGDFNSNSLWANESIIDVYLLLSPKAYPFKTGDEEHKHITAQKMFKGPTSGTSSVADRDNYVNAFMDPDTRQDVRVLKKWTLELASGSSSAEAFLPFDIYHKFKTPLITEVTKNNTVNQAGQCNTVEKNLLQLLFVARGAVHMTYEVRQYFTDA